MLIQTFPSGPFSTNAYVISCPQTKQAAVIDPAPDSASPILNYLEQHEWSCSKILLTHSHWDHIADVAALKRVTQAPVYIHALDTPNLEQPGTDGLPCWIPIQGVKADYLLTEGETVTVGELPFVIIHTPGHTPGSICYHNLQNHVLFSGDTLFQGTIGNLSFPTSQPYLMWSSLEKLSKLDPQTHVYPGHGEPTTIGSEPWLSRAEELFG